MSELLQQEIQHLQQQIRIGKQAAPQCLQAFVDEAALTQSLTAELNPLWAAYQPVLASLSASLKDPFYWLVLGEDAYLYERQHQRLWCLPTGVGDFSLFKISAGKSLPIEKRCWQGQAWKLPSVEALVSFAQTPENPMRRDSTRLFGQWSWLTAAGHLDLDDRQPSPTDGYKGYFLGVIRITWDALLRLSQQQGGCLIANTPDLTRQLHTHYDLSDSIIDTAAFVQGLKQAPCALAQVQASAAFRALDAWYHKIPVRVAHQIGAQIGRQVQQQVRRLPASLQPLLHPKSLVTTLMAEVVPVIKARHVQLAQAPQQAFYWLVQAEEVFLLEARTHWVWQIPKDLEDLDTKAAQTRLSQDTGVEAHQRWQLPSADELHTFAQTPNNPMRQGSNARLFNRYHWLTTAGWINLDNAFTDPTKDGKGACLGVIKAYGQHTWADLLALCADKGWRLVAASPVSTETQEALHGGDTPNLAQLQQSLQDLPNNADLPDLPDFDQQIPARVRALVMQSLTHLDAEISPLPPLTVQQMQDLGLWELWGLPAETLEDLAAQARNPALDVRACPVAIDFGTSSTVVGYLEQGRKKLIRIGVKDFTSPVEQIHFENPTILEFVDIATSMQAWQSTPYRPRIPWGAMRCSHEALASLRDNEGDTRITASILAKMKQWALRDTQDTSIRLCDQVQGQAFTLAPLTLRNPTKGQALQVDSEYPLDPIELYAYFLGLSINWRQRGIFLQYYMTFPVAYPQAVKDKILSSFRRGLQRSLPQTLLNSPQFDDFSVEERASEPAAFAATALPYFGIQPTAAGQAYGVFDFGGGTADFDFGVYREPNAEEEDQGYEEVLEHFGAAGDKFLGGENLLEHLAYETFKANLDLCRSKSLAFTQPLDGEDFPGSELLLEQTQAAATNTQVLMGRLRAFWEKNEHNSQGIEKVKLLDRQGQEVNCELSLPYEDLEAFLQQRLLQGVKNFFTALHKAFTEADLMPEKVHLFLAGNASLSPRLQRLFAWIAPTAEGAQGEETDETALALAKAGSEEVQAWVHQIFGKSVPEFVLFQPITENPQDPYQATTKTGVALGLLDLCPGSPMAIVNRAALTSQGEAPFNFYVGAIRRRQFQPALKRHAPYGVWQEAGPVRENTFTLVSSQSPAANTGLLAQDDPTLIHQRLTFVHAQGHKVFVRPLTPYQIELCTGVHREAVEAGEISNQQKITLG
ncbi:hypothetical protein SAMN05421831_10690 [Allopseudospirillum japonicum]|uniref:Uncharacterized protein n=1 Tax=Allopseudospirillum japonicum TaxID=64971 RepID=A0A1H6SFY0_9GAMM|nr:hypothetical protein [Allopseudospirillum japonicum]SEI64804.1 hypothetical protein SAMN05421831_10690 [Allopseudospirillum japonicum]